MSGLTPYEDEQQRIRARRDSSMFHGTQAQEDAMKGVVIFLFVVPLVVGLIWVAISSVIS